MKILFFLAVSGILVYTFFSFLIIWALGKLRPGITEEMPFISIIVAARNEENNIETCIASLENQDYPHDLYEIVVANDRSTDSTSKILEKLASKYGNIRIISIAKTAENWAPKKFALSKAIDAASGEIILQTDADCLPLKTWISSTVSCFMPEVNMVCGPAPYFTRKGIINSFVRHEYIWNIALAAGSITLGYGTHASGRNLAFRKKTFIEAGGYGSYKNIKSGDDTLLLKKLSETSRGSVIFNPSPEAHVYTESPDNLKSFIRQRIRHMSTGKFFNPVHIIIGTGIYGFQMILILLLLTSFFSMNTFALFLFLFALKIFIDFAAAMKVKKVIGVYFPAEDFLLNELLLIVYMALMPVSGLVIPVNWKENS